MLRQIIAMASQVNVSPLPTLGTPVLCPDAIGMWPAPLMMIAKCEIGM
jgi:hypothetical protein